MMKRNVTLAITTILLMGLASCGDAKNKQNKEISTPEEIETKKANTPEIVEASFSDEMIGKVFNAYQQIRIALVNSNSEEVNLAVENLAKSSTGEGDEMNSIVMAMAETKDIEKIIKNYPKLSANDLTQYINKWALFKSREQFSGSDNLTTITLILDNKNT